MRPVLLVPTLCACGATDELGGGGTPAVLASILTTDSADIRAAFYDVLNSIVLVLREYDKTLIEVMGHTDSTGSREYNQRLSEGRAASVAEYLVAQKLDSRRVLTQGFGESYPIASNASAEGRQQNRRVELRLVPITG